MRAADFRQSWRECDRWVRIHVLKCVNDVVSRCVFEFCLWFSVLVTNVPLCITLQVMLQLASKTAKHYGCLFTPKLTWMRQTGAHSCFTFVNDVVLRFVFETRFWFSVVVTDAPFFMKPPFMVAQKRASCWLTPKLTWMRLTGAQWCFEMCKWCCVSLCCENSLLIFGSSNQGVALHVAAAGDHVEACKLLIDANADVNATDGCAFIFQMCQWCCSGLCFWNSLLIFCCSNQRTALHHVVDRHDDCQIFRLLIVAKHAVNATDGCAFMFYVCWWCCVALCFWILPLIFCSSDRRTALHNYVDRLDNCQIFRLLMGAKDAVNATDGCAFMFQIR